MSAVIPLSTGDPNTLGSYLKLSKAVFGDDSPPVCFLEAEIARTPHGENELVIQAEAQMVHLLGQLFIGAMDVDEVIKVRARKDR